MYELALFAGAGGGILGGILCGTTCVGAVEIERYPREVLKQRQRDGVLPVFPVWDDITTFGSSNIECREYFDMLKTISNDLVISGGFPCQDISTAGSGTGIDGERSGLWGEFARIIGEVRPARVEVENSPALTLRGLNRVLGDLSSLGYSAAWGVMGAVDVGAPHKRERIWVVANAEVCRDHRATGTVQGETIKSKRRSHECTELNGPGGLSGDMADPAVLRLQRSRNGKRTDQKGSIGQCGQVSWWDQDPADSASESRLDRVADGVANRVDRLKAIGNGQVPLVAATAWEMLSGE